MRAAARGECRSTRRPPARCSARGPRPRRRTSSPGASARCSLLVAEGLPNKLIARRLEISEKTVKAHLTNVFRRIGVTDRTQAALWAERNGLTRDRS